MTILEVVHMHMKFLLVAKTVFVASICQRTKWVVTSWATYRSANHLSIEVLCEEQVLL